ncbi:MAG: hypothetical protein QOI57_2960, partial [Rubrobacteraceae bacterium]|nr:hypothetical protein [Rubrobacteraceae bacterium]
RSKPRRPSPTSASERRSITLPVSTAVMIPATAKRPYPSSIWPIASNASFDKLDTELTDKPTGCSWPMISTAISATTATDIVTSTSTIPTTSKRVRGNIRNLRIKDCLCVSSSVVSPICCLAGSPIFNIFSRSPSSPLSWGSIPTALIVREEPGKLIGDKDEPSINQKDYPSINRLATWVSKVSNKLGGVFFTTGSRMSPSARHLLEEALHFNEACEPVVHPGRQARGGHSY